MENKITINGVIYEMGEVTTDNKFLMRIKDESGKVFEVDMDLLLSELLQSELDNDKKLGIDISNIVNYHAYLANKKNPIYQELIMRCPELVTRPIVSKVAKENQTASIEQLETLKYFSKEELEEISKKTTDPEIVKHIAELLENWQPIQEEDKSLVKKMPDRAGHVNILFLTFLMGIIGGMLLLLIPAI